MNLRSGIRLLAFVSTATFALAQEWPLEPHHDSGQSITGVFEGWFKNTDGSFSLLLGYYNRNLKDDVDIPVGVNNRIEPGGPDRGQPTHFRPGRMWGNFVIVVPKDFGTNKLNWTITANGKTTVIPASLKTDWEISPFIDATDNTPPFLSFKDFGSDSAPVQGPLPLVTSMTATVGEPLVLTIWTADDNRISPGTRGTKFPVTLTWSIFRAPGSVTFANRKPDVEPVDGKMPPKAKFAGKSTTSATFHEPGQYIIEVAATDASGEGGGGFQCCWTNAMVNVVVAPVTPKGTP